MTDAVAHRISAVAEQGSAGLSSGAGQPNLSPTDLAELMTAFTDVTTKLERTHEQLRGEVSRLNAELRDANEALQRSRRLAALGEMAAGISHEIRNPLGSIKLYATMLGEDLADRPEQQEVVEKIGRAVRGLDEIVGDVLSFARETKTRFSVVELESVVQGAIESCCAEVSGAVEFCMPEAGFEVECDSGLIQQALINVLRNAGEANRVAGGDSIRVQVEEVEIDREGRVEHGVAVSVHDLGDGLPESVIERMFNPFFTTRAAGTGLGLAIVHRIVDAHRGRVEVGNHEDSRGAWVRIELPMRQPVVVVRQSDGFVDDVREVVPQAGASPSVMRKQA